MRRFHVPALWRSWLSRRRLRAALAALEPTERDVYLLAAAANLSITEVASRLEVSSAEVERLLVRALIKLDERLP